MSLFRRAAVNPLAQLRCPQAVKVPARARRITARVEAKQGGMGDEDMDVAVFRFTLGIPGFEDRMIPRVVSYIGAAGLMVNHIVTQVSEAQARAEGLCGALVLILFLVPEIEERILEAQPGRGRIVGSYTIAGSTNAFLLDKSLQDKPKQELAWSSFALIKNTNSAAVVLLCGGKALMARGALGSSVVTPGQFEESLAAISKDISLAASTSKQMAEVQAGKVQQLWLPDRSAITNAGLSSCATLPQSSESLLVQHVAGGDGKPDGLLLLFSERPRALSDRERKWAAALGAKLSGAL